MTPERLEAWERPGGRVAIRNHVLVLPSVLCAARVAQDVAAAAGGIALPHQHGCSQIGDDGAQTGAALAGIARGPNVGGVVVVSLGCETVQGRELAQEIAARGQRTELVGIQDAGGSDAARAAAVALATELREALDATPRVAAVPSQLVVGVEVSRPSAVAEELVALMTEAGAAVLVTSGGSGRGAASGPPASADAFSADPAPAAGRTLALVGAGRGAQQHAALAARGAHMIVSFPDPGQPPAGFATCPVVAVHTASPLHDAIADEFDATEADGAARIWERVLAVAAGRPAATEALDGAPLALPRLAMTL